MRKIYLHLAASLSIMIAITQSVRSLAETPEFVGISPKRGIVTAHKAQPQELSALAVNEAQENTDSNDPAQVTSVSQLQDVQPTDWAFLALQSLVEQYGCIAGYPNSTYRGNRALTRYEFASGLNACLQRVNELIASATSDLVRKEDLAIIERLQAEFAKELATLRDRLDSLEAHTDELKANQFSTTTKLTGQGIFALNAGGFSGRRIFDPTGAVIANQQPNATFTYRVALDLNTSFHGTDLLKLHVDTVPASGNDNAGGFLEPNFGSVLEYAVRGTPNKSFAVSRVYYTFTPVKDLSLTVGPQIVTTDFVDINSYANGNGKDFSTLALVNNILLFPIFGPSAGAFLNWNPGQGPFKVRALYAAGDGANPRSNNQMAGSVFAFANLLYPKGGGSRGLFGDPYQGTVELEYSPSKAFAARFQYSGGNVFNGRFDVFGANLELALSKCFGVFGRYGYGSYNDTEFGNIHPNFWMAGVSLQDLFVPGAVAGVAAGQPFIDNAVGNSTQTNIEAFYNLPVNDHIRVTPLVQVIVHPSNQNNNGTIVTGTLRTVFSF